MSDTPSKGRGRPKKTKDEVEDTSAVEPEAKKVKSDSGEARGRGRPKGTAAPKKADPVDPNAPKRGRGRPKGTTKKNKKAAAKKTGSSPVKGRGRPKKQAVEAESD